MKKTVCSKKYPNLGSGQITKVNPYKKKGTPEYQENTHYKVYFPKDDMYITFFKKDLEFTKE